jgi:hypothetical protein
VRGGGGTAGAGLSKGQYYLGKDFIFRRCLLASSSFLGARIRPFNLLRFSSTVKVTSVPQEVVTFVWVFFMGAIYEKGGHFAREGLRGFLLIKKALISIFL